MHATHPVDARPVAIARLVAWMVLLSAGIVLLSELGRGPLGTPSSAGSETWRAWFASRDAATIVFAGLRLATLLVAWYLLGVTLLGVASRVLRSAQLVAATDVLTAPAVRRLLQSAGVGLTAAALTACSHPPSVSDHAVAAATVPTETERPEMAPVAEDRLPGMIPIPVPIPAEPAPAPAQAPAVAAREWTVQPGESFWSIAEDVMAQQRGGDVAEPEVAQYWQRLVQANIGRLADRSNPDLIYPGQTFRLPAPDG
jgi:hypothetical protein